MLWSLVLHLTSEHVIFQKMLRMILNTRQSFSTDTTLWALVSMERWNFFSLSLPVCKSP